MMINPNYDDEYRKESFDYNKDDAQSYGGQAVELHDFYHDSGFAAERAGDLKLALGLYEQAVHSQPRSALAWYNYGDALLGLNRPEEAVVALRKAVELSPRTALFHYDLGKALYDLDQNAEASREFALIVAADPHLARASSNLVSQAMTNLALCQEKLGQRTNAVETLKPSLLSAVNTLFNLGFLHFQAKQHAEALPLFQAAILLRPDHEDITHMLGSTLLELNRTQEAVKYLQKATKLNPHCSCAWYDLGLALARLKRRKPARAHFRKALRLEADNPAPYYDLACLDALERQTDDAFLNLEEAIARGFKDRSHLLKDTDLKSLHRDARWKQLLVEIRRLNPC